MLQLQGFQQLTINDISYEGVYKDGVFLAGTVTTEDKVYEGHFTLPAQAELLHDLACHSYTVD